MEEVLEMLRNFRNIIFRDYETYYGYTKKDFKIAIVAVMKELSKPKMKLIQSNSELEVGREYWCKPKTTAFDPIVMRCSECGGIKYLGAGIWATDNNNQALEKYDIVGPIEHPNFDDYKGE